MSELLKKYGLDVGCKGEGARFRADVQTFSFHKTLLGRVSIEDSDNVQISFFFNPTKIYFSFLLFHVSK